MADGMYEVLALIPETSDFTLERAADYFAALTFNKFRSGKFVFKNQSVRVELATSEGKVAPSGFRVYYGDWAVVAWLESGAGVLGESQEFAQEDDLPASAEVIAGWSRRLSVWSDEDLEFDWTDQFNEYTDQLRERFGVSIHDCVNGCWWS